MDWLLSLKLIRLFDFYLALTFLASTVVRVRQYQTILQLVRAVPSRWPRLFQLVKRYRSLFLTWGTFVPLLFTLGLWLLHTFLLRVVLADSTDLTVRRLLEFWVAIPFVTASGLAMLCFDLYGAFRVSVLDQQEMEKYFDQAEYWLKSWTAPVVHFFTFGYINPRKMVDAEVRSALVNASALINSSLWWTSAQAVLRVLFGVTLWVSFALTRG